VGPDDIRKKVAGAPPGTTIRSQADLTEWLRRTREPADTSGLVRLTFVVDGEGHLRVADRHSEHVACAEGGPVLAAGEMAVVAEKGKLEVVEISNQSTGFCPEPESWPTVGEALDRLGLPHPGDYTHRFIFRRCPACGQRNIVK